MSLKSLGIASLGLLKKAIKQALHITSNGLIRIGEGDKEEIFIQPGAMTLAAKRVELPDTLAGNNLAVLLTNHSLL